MKTRRWASVFLATALTLCASTASAQQPKFTGGQVTPRSAAAGLDREFRAGVGAQTAPAWFGYAVPMAGEEHHMCCYDNWSDGQSNCCGRCRLEGRDGVNISTGDSREARRVNLERQNLIVLFRVEQRKVGKLRTYSEECELDTGGLPVVWFIDVRPAESVALLQTFIITGPAGEESDDRRTGKNALSAIAMHADPSADRALEQFAAPSQPEWLRRDLTFWLGSARGVSGYKLLERIIRDDPSDKVREQAIFGLSVSKVPEALDAMIAVAKNDRSTRVRGQALFWLGQRAGQEATQAITNAIDNDPETEVKKKAVFALSQLPKEQGVPMLIQVAKTNRNSEVRKQAIFWLGQSNDPRALAFFQEVLGR